MIVAAIPVKRLSEAKSRLSPSLLDHERRDLVRRLLARTVDVLHESGVIDRVALVTPEPSTAESLQVELIADSGELNDALAAAVQWALVAGARSLLIVPADLPFISAAEIRAFVDDDPALYGIAIAPTEDGGTGALLLTPPNIIPPAFGPGSYERHLALARLFGVRAERVLSDALSFDLDTPEDLRRYVESPCRDLERVTLD
jgi:2-phospho-L-lactate/phosphoenolpyruvate guanylyltransferase